MEEIEKNLRIDNIKALREMGNDIINNIIEIGKIDKEIKDKKSFSFLGSKKSGELAKLKADRDLKIEEQKNYKNKIVHIINLKVIFQEYLILMMNQKIKKIEFNLFLNL